MTMYETKQNIISLYEDKQHTVTAWVYHKCDRL